MSFHDHTSQDNIRTKATKTWLPTAIEIAIILIVMWILFFSFLVAMQQPDMPHAGSGLVNSAIMNIGMAIDKITGLEGVCRVREELAPILTYAPTNYSFSLADISRGFTIKSVLTFIHLGGLSLAITAVLVGDFVIIRWLLGGKAVSAPAGLLTFISHSVGAGLILLWCSGLGFLIFYGFFSPDALANPKIWAKLCIVCVLTLNGFIIHTHLPRIIENCNQAPIFSGFSVWQRSIALAAGAVSTLSWFSAFYLGIAKELNFAIYGASLLAIYIMLLALGCGCAQLGHIWAKSYDPERTRMPPLEQAPVPA